MNNKQWISTCINYNKYSSSSSSSLFLQVTANVHVPAYQTKKKRMSACCCEIYMHDKVLHTCTSILTSFFCILAEQKVNNTCEW